MHTFGGDNKNNQFNMNLREIKGFNLFAKDKGISSMQLHYHDAKIKNNMTPYVLEERQMNVTQMDVFSRLMYERIIWIGGEVNDQMSMIVQAQLMFLNSLGHTDITMHVDTPGGSVKSGLSIVDVMDYVDSDIRTINTGMAASMGSVLLGAGTRGKRSSLRFSKTMLHQSSGGIGGNIQDAEINWNEWNKTNILLFELLGEYCGKTAEEVKIDSQRDFWLSAEEAKVYGIIDEVVIKNKK